MEQICEKCKQNVSEDFEFCPYCGYAITLGAKELTKQKFAVNEGKTSKFKLDR